MGSRHRALLAVLTILAGAGCGGGAAEKNNEAASNSAPFLGVWSCSGAQIATCGTSSRSDTFDFTMTVTRANSPNGITTGISNNTDVTTGASYGPADIDWTLSGSAANLNVPLTLATVPGSVGGTWTPTYSSGSLTRSGAALLWMASGSAAYVNGSTETCGFTQSYSCSASVKGGSDAGAGDGSSVPQLDPSLVATWSYSEGFFYPNPSGTPGVDVTNPPASLTLKADGSYSTPTSSVPMAPKGTWFIGATTAADWKQWRQVYNFPEKLTLDGANGVTWDGYVDDGDPSGESVGPPQCLDLFYTQKTPQAGYYYFVFCNPTVKK